ncbi:MAG: MBOAT family protein, partial [Rhodospirillaceae bacterium]
MLFNSFEFIFGFLPLAVLIFYLFTHYGHTNAAIYFLALASIFFYGWWNWNLIWLLIGSIFINYTWGRILSTNRSKVYLTIGVIFNLTLLGWFKYAGFLTSTVNDLSGTQFNLGNIVLPLGISFFTFQQIAYLVDTQRGIAYENHFGRYCLFVAFFPQLIAGPIVHHGEILPQYAQSEKIRLRLENIVVGISIFTIGLFKKVILADPMGEYADRVFSAAAHGDPVTFVTAWAANFAVALEIY